MIQHSGPQAVEAGVVGSVPLRKVYGAWELRQVLAEGQTPEGEEFTVSVSYSTARVLVELKDSGSGDFYYVDPYDLVKASHKLELARRERIRHVERFVGELQRVHEQKCVICGQIRDQQEAVELSDGFYHDECYRQGEVDEESNPKGASNE